MDIERLLWSLPRIAETLTVIASLVAALGGIAVAMRLGVLKRIRLGSLEIEGAPPAPPEAVRLVERALDVREPIPFEAEQLARYYSQVLSQSRISFWFSLIFAALGFAVIIGAAMLYSTERSGNTIASFIAGMIVDAVAALFFVQSRQAQKAMAEFFDKLRRDREALESRRISESISNPVAKDAMRIHLAIHLAAVPEARAVAESIVAVCLAEGFDEAAVSKDGGATRKAPE